MQVGKVSWVGQTFALARCSNSQGKKPRSRRTKEERRKMVESFIKRYRGSNNGNFPSLNLTHKEVGGSFYTIREIVREIIQENKLLRPGSLNSQAFNLEDSPEQPLPEHVSSDYMYNLPSTTIEDSSVERQNEFSDCNNGQTLHEVLPTFSSTFCDNETTNIEEELALHSQVILDPQVIDGDSYEGQHCKSWHGNVDSRNEESSDALIELSGRGQNYSATQNDDELCVEVNLGENCEKYESEDPVGFSQPLSITSTVGVSMAKDIKSDMQENDTEKVLHSSEEREKAVYVHDKIENLSPSGHTGGSSSKHAREVDPLESGDTTISGLEQMSLKRAGALDISGPTEAGFIASKNVTHMPVCSDQDLSSIESPTIVDQKTAISVKALITDLAGHHTYESISVQVQPPVMSSNDLHMDVVSSIRASGESGLKNCISNSNSGEKSTPDGTNSESSEAKERMADTEANPLFAIIKGLVSAFVKFWTG